MQTSPVIPVEVTPGLPGWNAVRAAVADLVAGTTNIYALLPPNLPQQDSAAVASLESAASTARARGLVVFTSGSSGAAKPVLLPTAALTSAAQLSVDFLGKPMNWLTLLPVTGIGGVMTLLRAAVSDTECQAWSGLAGAESFTPTALQAVPLEESAWGTSLVPTQLVRLLQCGAAKQLARFEVVLVGGAALADKVVDHARSAGINLVTTYGCTETAGGVVYDGIPLPDIAVTTPNGLVQLSGPTIAWGYLDGSPGFGGTFLTNDLGSFENGHLTVQGRADDIVKIGGNKTALSAVTSAAESFPGVLAAHTAAIPDIEWGHKLTVAVTVRPDLSASTQLATQIQQHIRDQLGRHAKADVEFVSTMATSHTGKTVSGTS